MPTKRKSTLKRREDIVGAARRLIIKHGSEHVTVKSIAKEGGFTEGAIYRHFKSKREILSMLVDQIREDLLKDFAVDAVSDNTPMETLDFVLLNHLSGVEQRRGVAFLVVAEVVSFGDRHLNNKILSAIEDYINKLKELLTRAIQLGEIREGIDPEAAALVLFGCIQGLVNVWALSSNDFDPREKFRMMWRVLFEGLANKTPS